MEYSELKDMTLEQLKQKEDVLRKELFELRFKKANQQLKNIGQIGSVKKDIARVLTAMNKRPAASGIPPKTGKGEASGT